MDQLARFSINCHSSIRCGGNTVLWFDPYRVAAEPHDGDVIFVTHSHSDLTLLDYLERRTALGTLARREEIPVYCVYLDGTAGQAGYYLSEVSITCLRAAFPAE